MASPRAQSSGVTREESEEGLLGSPINEEEEAEVEETVEEEEDNNAVLPSQSVAAETFNAPGRDLSDTTPINPDKVNDKELKKYMLPGLFIAHVSQLRWDLKQEWGQIRKLNNDRVQYYVRSLKESPPRVPVRILLRTLGQGIFVLIRFGLKMLNYSQRTNLLSSVDNTSVLQSEQCTITTKMSKA